jgi:isopenicillin N synthase-like dioxygenase
MEIASISLAYTKGSSKEREAAAALRDACSTVGFFYLVDHGISTDAIDGLFARSAELFALPLAIKRVVYDSSSNRGYTAWEEETLDPTAQSKGDTKEGFYIGRDVSAAAAVAGKLEGPNVWPAEGAGLGCVAAGWRDEMEAYFAGANGVGFRLLRLLALALDLDAEYFLPHFDAGMTMLRLLHYSAERSAPSDGVFACGAHADYGMLTLLLTDDVPGLQINVDGDGWNDVPPRRGAFIVNLGAMLERWSNGAFRATVHRVVSTSGRERYSVPFFFEPAFDTRVECICAAGEAPRYPPVTSGEYLLTKYAQTHADFQAAE